MLRFAAILLLACGAVAACTSDEGSDDAVPTAVSDEAFLALAQQAVHAALLTEDDLPAAFDLVPDDESADDDEQPEFAFTGECAEFNEDMNFDGSWLGSVTEAETGDFEDEDGDGFGAGAAVFRTAEMATQETNDAGRFVDTCIDQFKGTYVSLLDAALQERDESKAQRSRISWSRSLSSRSRSRASGRVLCGLTRPSSSTASRCGS